MRSRNEEFEVALSGRCTGLLASVYSRHRREGKGEGRVDGATA
jgi:hypothetical protein